jgi:hypothetical protein
MCEASACLRAMYGTRERWNNGTLNVSHIHLSIYIVDGTKYNFFGCMLLSSEERRGTIVIFLRRMRCTREKISQISFKFYLGKR